MRLDADLTFCVETRRSHLSRPCFWTRVSRLRVEKRKSRSRACLVECESRVLAEKRGPPIVAWPVAGHGSCILTVRCRPHVGWWDVGLTLSKRNTGLSLAFCFRNASLSLAFGASYTNYICNIFCLLITSATPTSTISIPVAPQGLLGTLGILD